MFAVSSHKIVKFKLIFFVVMVSFVFCLVTYAEQGNNDNRSDCTSAPFSENQQRNWESRGLVIEDIRIQIGQVFSDIDPSKNNWLFQWANALHIKTKPHVIRNQLLMREGDTFSLKQINESERILRANAFLYDAQIYPYSICRDRIYLLVRVRDLWTFVPDVSVARSGGDNRTRLGFRDSNFLGLGKEVVLVQKGDADRKGLSFTYVDRNVLGSRNILAMEFTDNDDGGVRFLGLQHPFYSLDSRWTAGGSHRFEDRIDSLYFRNREFQEFLHEDEENTVFAGFSHGLINSRTHRWLLGYSELTDNFFSTDETRPDEAFPQDRNYVYPWIAWQMIEDRYAETRNFNLINRTEDLNFGLDIFLRMGYSSKNLGADNKGLLFDGRLIKTFQLNEKQVFSLGAFASGVESSEGLENFITTLESRYYNNFSNKQQFFVSLQLSKANNLFIDHQLLLGGDNGLRGYPARYQTGDRRYLLNVEQRFHFNKEFLSLFDLGAVAFAGVGRSWFPNRDNGVNGGALKDVGFGLRISPTRSGKNIVLHLDVAFPLDKDDERLDDYQISLETRSRF